MTNIKTKDAKPLDKFEPCPFCGHHGQILTTVKTSTHYALSCQNCGATGPYTTKREEAGWNNRVLPKQSEKDTAIAMTLAEICQIIGVDEKPMLSELPDLVRAAVKPEWLPIEDAPRDGTIITVFTTEGCICSARYWSAAMLNEHPEVHDFCREDDEYWSRSSFTADIHEDIDECIEPTLWNSAITPPQTERE